MEEVLAMNWKCYDCNMTFTNPNLLQKHKSRFCVGGQLGDPDHLMLRKGFYSETVRDEGDKPEADQPRYNPNADPKIQQLAETHGRQMQFLQDRNRDLERQREEIRRRLEELGKRPMKDDDSMNALLQELRDQEARNQKMLEELRRQLLEARHVPPGETKKQPFIYPVYYGNSLVAEITAMRQAYLQNGGNDPDILHQLAQMQAEAQAIDDSLRNRPQQSKNKRDPDSLHALELENERLQRQLLLLQEQNLAARHRRKGDREGRRRLPGFTLVKEKTNKRPLGLDTEETAVDPLDINEKELNKKKEVKPKKDFISPRRAWANHYDPVKVRIDKDVGNTAFKVSGRLWDGDEDEEEVFIDQTRVKRATLLDEPTTDLVTTVPNKVNENPRAYVLNGANQNVGTYYKQRFPLKSGEKEIEIERLDLLSVIQEASRANTAGSGSVAIPLDQRSEIDTVRSNGQRRPQLVIETNPPT